jgi:hypothetical protein
MALYLQLMQQQSNAALLLRLAMPEPRGCRDAGWSMNAPHLLMLIKNWILDNEHLQEIQLQVGHRRMCASLCVCVCALACLHLIRFSFEQNGAWTSNRGKAHE